MELRLYQPGETALSIQPCRYLILARIAIPVGCSIHLGVAAIVSLWFRGDGASGSSPPEARPPNRLSKDTGSVCVPVVEWPMPKSYGEYADECL